MSNLDQGAMNRDLVAEHSFDALIFPGWHAYFLVASEPGRGGGSRGVDNNVVSRGPSQLYPLVRTWFRAMHRNHIH